MNAEPAGLATLQPLTPPALDRLVDKCLAKHPDQRWQSAADLADELRWISTGSGSIPGVVAPTPERTAFRRRSRWMASAAVLVLVAAAVVWWRGAAPTSPVAAPRAQHTQVTFSGDVQLAALAPDGRTLAYAVKDAGGVIRVQVRDIEGGEALEIWHGTFVAALAWMLDGGRVLVSGREFNEKDLSARLVPRFGGSARRVEGLQEVYVAQSPDGSRLAGTHPTARGYRVLSVASGTSIFRNLAGARWISGLSWNRESERLAVIGEAENSASAVWIASPADGGARLLPQPAGKTVSDACWSPVADALYLVRQQGPGTATEVVRMSFPEAGSVHEETLLTGIRAEFCQVSADGQRLLQVRTFSTSNLWRLNLSQPTTPAALTTGTSQFADPDVSPDGQFALATSWSREPPELVRIPAHGGSPSSFVGNAKMARWSPDGRRLAFISSRTGRERIWVADGNGENATEVQGAEFAGNPLYWWPDGRLAWPTPDLRDYRIRDLATGKEELLVADPSVGFVWALRVSPKRDQVAVARSRDGTSMGLWLIGWPDRRERLLTPSKLWPIAWSPDGSFIYAFRGNEVVRVSAATGAVQSVGRFPVGLITYQSGEGCSMTPDRRAIVCGLSDDKKDAWVVDHFDPHVPATTR